MPKRHSDRAAGLPVFMRPIPKGRPTEERALAEIGGVLADEPRRADLLIEHMHRIQETYGGLSREHLVALAEEMRLSMAEVYEVATFYHHFDVLADGEAPPAPAIRICDSIVCEMAGARALIDETRASLGAAARVIPAPCIGRCERAPAALVGQRPVEAATPASIRAAFDSAEDGGGVAAPDYAAGGAGEPGIDYAAYRAGGGYRILAECVGGGREREEVLEAIEGSGLRGLGGAGFPAARKWRFVLAEPAPRILAINADEGEPGTFKDRYCMESAPHRFLEGTLLAAWAVDASEIYIYLRDEYPGCREILTRELAALRADPPCPVPAIHLRRGAGAYICGEETGLIESVEGRRGEPRLRPPFPAQNGVFGRPTLVHNVETVYWIPEILRHGPDWFSGEGRRGRSGMRLFSVSGRVREPGVHLAPAGVSARELVEEFAGGMLSGHRFYAYLPGGASGGILPESMADLPLDFGTLEEHGCFVGSGAVVILSDRDRARDAAVNLMRFFAHESCGKCTPCRVGTAKAVGLMDAPRWNVPLLRELSSAMVDASICGLGQAAPNPVLSVIRFFEDELESDDDGSPRSPSSDSGSLAPEAS